MKRLVLNMVYPLKTGNNSPVLPLFLRDVGRYYWGEKTFKTQYRLSIKKCVENELVRTFRFFTKEKLMNESAIQGNIKMIRHLVDRGGADINAYTPFGTRKQHPLSLASENGHFEAVKYLVENKADVHVKNDYPLRVSCQKGYFEIVKLLVENGADIHANGDYALCHASENGHLEVVKYLLVNGVKYNLGTALVLASKNGHLEVAKCLIEKQGIINNDNEHLLSLVSVLGFCDWDSTDALQVASQNGHFEVVKLLVESGADVHANGENALQLACANGHFEVVKYLINHGARVPAGNKEVSMVVDRVCYKK